MSKKIALLILLLLGLLIIRNNYFISQKSTLEVFAQGTETCTKNTTLSNETPHCISNQYPPGCLDYTAGSAAYKVYTVAATGCSGTCTANQYCGKATYYDKTASCTTCPETLTGAPASTAAPTETTAPVATITAPAGCPKKAFGDANCDNVISDPDYDTWKCEFLGNGTCANLPLAKTADFNLNGKVDLADFEIWRSNRFIPLTPTPTIDPLKPYGYQITPAAAFGKTMQQICNDKGAGWNCVNGCEYAANYYAYFCVNCEKGWTTTDGDCYYPVPTTATYLTTCCYQNPTIAPTLKPDTCDAVNCPYGCCLNNQCYVGKFDPFCGVGGSQCSVCTSSQKCIDRACVNATPIPTSPAPAATNTPIPTSTSTPTPTPTCASGLANCDGNWANGCEVSLKTSHSNCGRCGNVCGTNKVCSNGSCVYPSEY